MVSKVVMLFLLGATLSTAQFVPNVALMPNFHLGSITLPNLPIPLMQNFPAPITDPCEPEFIREVPIVKPVIGQQTAMSAFVMPMPELPVRFPEEPVAVEPCSDDLPMKIVTVPEYVKPLKPIPAAPILAPAVLPELPVRVEVPKPVTPLIVERPIEDPCITEVVVPQAQPIVIPQPPKPEFVIPEPVKVEVMKPMPMPFLPEHAEVEIMADPCEPSAQPIMQLADYPFFERHLPSEVAIKNEKFREFLVPNMVLNRFRPVGDILSMPYLRRVL